MKKTLLMIPLILFSALTVHAGGSSTVGPEAPTLYFACKKPNIPKTQFWANVGNTIGSAKKQSPFSITIVDYSIPSAKSNVVFYTPNNAPGAGFTFKGNEYSLHVTLSAPIIEDGEVYSYATLTSTSGESVPVICQRLSPLP